MSKRENVGMADYFLSPSANLDFRAWKSLQSEEQSGTICPRTQKYPDRPVFCDSHCGQLACQASVTMMFHGP